ncbi:hypothetical protein [uncultured Rhodoblastus sp.]|uniref:hypothetical protein n=1 Tax=uncultured Rhodoblastus sp. TaxID=543037 RepID=UPI0025E8EFAA|nr:hypothetical protein [uncultured Rhodoblastus sp.]
MRYDKNYLLGLLPAIYLLRDRLREEEPHGPLEALIEAIAEQLGGVERNVEQLYDDLFIETCADWVVPYIGDMIGYAPLAGPSAAVASPRAEVANTIGYRRRKGTLSVLETLAADVTGWGAVATECYTRLVWNESMKHARPRALSTASLRAPPPTRNFVDPPRLVDVRRIGSGRGVWNIPNIAIELYPLSAFALRGGTPGTPDPAHPLRLTFDPLGRDAPLFQPARPRAQNEARGGPPRDIPSPASRRRLFAELEDRRARIAAGAAASEIDEAAVAFTASDPIARIAVGGAAIEPESVEICDLSDWQASTRLGIRASIDPVLGRVVLAEDPGAATLAVDYVYGFSGHFGAGAYARDDGPADVDIVAGDDLAAAIAAAAAHDADARVAASATFPGDLAVVLAAGRSLTLRAGSNQRPAIGGKLTVTLGAGASLSLIGFLIGDGVEILGGPGAVALQQCTVPSSVVAWTGAAGGAVSLSRCLVGALQIDPLTSVSAADGVIDAGDDANAAIAANAAGDPAGALTLDSVTIVGEVRAREIALMQNALVTGRVTSARTQQGCVRFCYLPRASVTPRRYQCQPETAARRAVAAAKAAGASASQLAALDIAATAGVRPEFVSLAPADPAYARLGPRCAPEIRAGAEDGSEVGVFRSLQQIHKENNLRKRVAEYLKIGLEAGVFTTPINSGIIRS